MESFLCLTVPRTFHFLFRCHQTVRLDFLHVNNSCSVVTFLGVCDLGWVFHNHACYHFIFGSPTSSKSWANAHQKCRSNGAYLTAIQSAQEQAFLQSQLPSAAGQVWIGLNDLHQHGSFVWTDGTPVQFNVWGTGQPSDVNHNESCVLMNLDSGHQSGTWSTANCEIIKAGYICEKFVGNHS